MSAEHSFDNVQKLVGNWTLSTGEIDEDYQAHHLTDEVAELHHELSNGRDREAIVGEVADIAIALLGYAEQHNIDVVEAIMAKMALVYLKYPPHVMVELQAEGLSRAEAFAYMKDLWEKNNPKSEY